MKPDEIKLGYLMVSSPLPNVYIGGAMVTDGRGLPVEFRYTEPIQPTKIQQILYGQVLSSYIKREVILETLVKSLETKFSYLLVTDENLADYEGKGFSIIRISETKTPPLSQPGETQEISATEILLQTSKEGSPLKLYLPEKKNAPKTAEGGEAAAKPQKPPYDILVEAGATMEIPEPLKRIEKALETICQEAGVNRSEA